MAAPHLVGAIDLNGKRRMILRDVPTYTEALAIHDALLRGTDVRELVVRSMDDPDWKHLPDWRQAHYDRPALIAQREYRKREVRKTVTHALSLLPGEGVPITFDGLVNMARQSLAAQGIKPERFTVEDALKARITLGRCRRQTWTRGGCDRAWFWPRKHGRIGELACPACGGPLSQTTLAYHRPFHRLDHARKEVQA